MTFIRGDSAAYLNVSGVLWFLFIILKPSWVRSISPMFSLGAYLPIILVFSRSVLCISHASPLWCLLEKNIISKFASFKVFRSRQWKCILNLKCIFKSNCLLLNELAVTMTLIRDYFVGKLLQQWMFLMKYSIMLKGLHCCCRGPARGSSAMRRPASSASRQATAPSTFPSCTSRTSSK